MQLGTVKMNELCSMVRHRIAIVHQGALVHAKSIRYRKIWNEFQAGARANHWAIGPASSDFVLREVSGKNVLMQKVFSGTPSTKGNRIGHFADLLYFFFVLMKSMDFQ